MVQKYSFIKLEGTFITCNNKIITASASASATGNTIEESDNTAYMYAKQDLEFSAQQSASENNLILKKLIKIKTVSATNIDPNSIVEINNVPYIDDNINNEPNKIFEIDEKDETYVNDTNYNYDNNIFKIIKTYAGDINDNDHYDDNENIAKTNYTYANDNIFYEVNDEMFNNILKIEKITNDTISNLMEMEIRDEIEYILDNQPKLEHSKLFDVYTLPKNI